MKRATRKPNHFRTCRRSEKALGRETPSHSQPSRPRERLSIKQICRAEPDIAGPKASRESPRPGQPRPSSGYDLAGSCAPRQTSRRQRSPAAPDVPRKPRPNPARPKIHTVLAEPKPRTRFSGGFPHAFLFFCSRHRRWTLAFGVSSLPLPLVPRCTWDEMSRAPASPTPLDLRPPFFTSPPSFPFILFHDRPQTVRRPAPPIRPCPVHLRVKPTFAHRTALSHGSTLLLFHEQRPPAKWRRDNARSKSSGH